MVNPSFEIARSLISPVRETFRRILGDAKQKISAD